MPYPERRTVLPLPNHGTFQLNPTAGAKVVQVVALQVDV